MAGFYYCSTCNSGPTTPCPHALAWFRAQEQSPNLPPIPPPVPNLDINTELGEGLPWWAGLLLVLAVVSVIAFGLWQEWR